MKQEPNRLTTTTKQLNKSYCIVNYTRWQNIPQSYFDNNTGDDGYNVTFLDTLPKAQTFDCKVGQGSAKLPFLRKAKQQELRGFINQLNINLI